MTELTTASETRHYFSCAECGRQYPLTDLRNRCECGAPLLIEWDAQPWDMAAISRDLFDKRLGTFQAPVNSGVWRYRELLPPIDDASIVSRPEGNTNLYAVGADLNGGFAQIGKYAGIAELYLKHEGENPTGSFKDRGMTVGVSQARALGAQATACASTGNTSASLASYAAQAGMACFVFVPEGKISGGKLAQTLGYGAVTLQIRGDFDAAMQLVQDVCAKLNIYLVNSVNPFRIEGQKTIAFEILQQLGWQAPDWIVLPAGNLGNTGALGKALLEAKRFGLIDKLPRVAAIQATGADPFYKSFMGDFSERFVVHADTVASAIKIGNPVSFERARSTIRATEGIVAEVSDTEILEAKALIDRAGIGCEPASAAALAGARQLVGAGVIKESDRVVAMLTGHILKDSENTFNYHMSENPDARYANRPIVIDATYDDVKRVAEKYMGS